MNLLGWLAAAALLAAPASADEVEAALEAALEAWRAGDVSTAKDELDFAATLMGEAKAEGLAAFLPAPLEGWMREEGASEAAAGFALFGGGLSAAAIYETEGSRIEIEILADSPMVATMSAMLATPQLMAAAGDVRRAGRQRYVLTRDGEAMALVAGRILVRLSGEGAEEDKIAYIEAVDFAGLAAF